MQRLSKIIGLAADKCLLLNLFDPAAYDGHGRSFIHFLVGRYIYEEDDEGLLLENIANIADILINKLKIDINQLTEDGEDTRVDTGESQIGI